MQIAKVSSVCKLLLDFIFPIVCIECRKEGSHFCIQCNNKLKKNEFQLCPVCGKPAPFGFTHPSCRVFCDLDGLISAVPYHEPLAKKLVEFCKYRFISGIAEVLGEMILAEIMDMELRTYFSKFVIAPIPLHPSKKRWRGFNQSELIANKISNELNIPMRLDLFFRKIKTKTQAELKDEERAINVAGAFQTIQDLNNLDVIIVDDVCTTGSTLKQACQTLKSAGANQVWGLVFAQGKPTKTKDPHTIES